MKNEARSKMKAYNGGSVNNLVNSLARPGYHNGIWVTDTAARATRYANAQATEIVDASLTQPMAENAVVLTVECNPRWSRRPESHPSLDHCEDHVTDYKIISAAIRFQSYERVLYGNKWTGYFTREQVVELLESRGITVEIV
jgi:hypothetical protein